MIDQKPLMTASSRKDDEVVSFSDTSRRNDAEMAVRKGFPSGRAHSAHLLRYGSSMMGLRHGSRRQALHLDQMGTADYRSKVVRLLIEGTCDADAATVTVSINGGDPADVIRLNPTQWYTNIEISETSAAHIAVTAKDAAENSSTAEQDIPWRATDIPLWCDIMIRKGDSLLLTQTGAGSVLEIDPGTGVWENAGAPGDTLIHTYAEAGIYTACSRIDGGEISSIEVTVVDVNLHGPVACQVGFMRGLDVFVTPVSAKESVDYSENDSRILHVEFDEYTDEGAALKLVPYTRGTPVLVARLGSNGPIVSTQEIDEFTTDVPARECLLVNDSINSGTSKLTMRPYIPDLILEFDMFASTSTFEGGVTHFEVNTTDDFTQVFDEDTGETVGELLYDIEVPDGENQYCFNIGVKQEMNPNYEIVDVGEDGSVNGNGCKIRVEQLILCAHAGPTAEGTLVMRTVVLSEHKHDITILGGEESKRPKFKDTYSYFIPKGYDCAVENNDREVTAVGADPGIYDVMIETTIFLQRIIVVKVNIEEIDRIPPRGKSIQVLVTTNPSSGVSCALMCETNPNTTGSATVIPSVITGTTTVKVTSVGTDQSWGQTGPAPNNIKLKAKIGTHVCDSEDFTICAHPTEVNFKFSKILSAYVIPGINGVFWGTRYILEPESDSGVTSDLDKVKFKEYVSVAQKSGYYQNSQNYTSPWTTILPSPGNNVSDHHMSGWSGTTDPAVAAANLKQAIENANNTGSKEYHQYFRYSCERCGVPENDTSPKIPKSGFKIIFTVSKIGTKHYVNIKKEGLANNGVAAGDVDDTSVKSVEIIP